MRQLRQMKLEDGEIVTMLRGAKKKGLNYRSDSPHAGRWGDETSYILVPCRSGKACLMRTASALKFDPNLVSRSSDIEVLLLGSHEQIDHLIRSGPTWCRAMRQRSMDPARAQAMKDHQFRKA